MRFDKLTHSVQQALSEAQSLAVGKSHSAIEAEHLLLAMLEQSGNALLPTLRRAGGNVERLIVDLRSAVEQLPTLQQPTGIQPEARGFVVTLTQVLAAAAADP